MDTNISVIFDFDCLSDTELAYVIAMLEVSGLLSVLEQMLA